MKKDLYVIYSEMFENGSIERWFYGVYSRAEANNIAIELNDYSCIQYCVCNITDIIGLNVLNVPNYVMAEYKKATTKKEAETVKVVIDGIEKEYNVFHLYNSIKKHSTSVYIVNGITIENDTITRKQLFAIIKK